MGVFKKCSCRDPETGRLLGKKCPRLDNHGHGKWYGRYEAPRSASGQRRQPRIGPFDRKKECERELAKVMGQESDAAHEIDRKTTLGEYLERRHAWREAEAQDGSGLKRRTLTTDREIIDLYLKPGLGHVKLIKLTDQRIRELYAAIRMINRSNEGEQPSEMLRRLLEVRAVRQQDGNRYSTRPVSEARLKRVHAVLIGALNDAVNLDRILQSNPARGVLRSWGVGRKARKRPLLWTDERVAHWLVTGQVPAKVMVWTPSQCGAFLDFAEHDRLYPLWHLAGYWGMRRGELIGLEKPDLSIARRRLQVRHSQPDNEEEIDDVKSAASDRFVVFDDVTAEVLTAWRKRQLEERMACGEGWTESGRVFTYQDGRALRPDYVTRCFAILVERYQACRRKHRAGWSVERIARRHRITEDLVRLTVDGPELPPVRFHDLRHGSATMLVAAGVPMKVVSDVLGHASEAFTSDVYTVVAEELAEEAAASIAAFVPRRKRA